MSRPRRALVFLAALPVLLAALALAGCGKDNPTNPGGGGGALLFDSGNIANGGMFSHLFTSADTIGYHCNIHGAAVMSGSVQVAIGNPVTATVVIDNNFYTPTPALIAPGGTVTWINQGTTHTVTSNE